MARWVGRWLLGLGMLHIGVGCVLYARPLGEIAAAGFWNSVDDFSPRAAAFWYLFTGAVTLVLAACVDHLEARQVRPWPRALGVGLLAMVAVGGVLMPLSGIWLFLPPAVASLRRAR